MRHLDTLEPGERFTTRSFKLKGKVLSQHEGSVYVMWDKSDYWAARKEHVSRQMECLD